MENTLTIIFWIIFTIYALRLAFRYLLPWLIARLMKRMANRMQQNSNSYQNPQSNDGRIKVDKIPKNEPKIDPEIGEYIDFEEINDNENPK